MYRCDPPIKNFPVLTLDPIRPYLPPANEVCEGYVFTGVCLSGGHAWLLRGGHAWLLQGGHAWLLGGACMVAPGGHVWLLWGGACVVARGCAWLLQGGACVVALGGMHGCSRGACMAAPGGVHGCSKGAWLLPGGHVWLLQGACVVAQGACVVAPGVCVWFFLRGGHAWLLWGACMVAPGGHMWLLRGGMHGCSGGVCGCSGGVHGCSRGGMHGFFDEIQSMSGRYASYWNAFLFFEFFCLLDWALRGFLISKTISLHVSLQCSSMIYMLKSQTDMFWVCIYTERQNCKRLTVLNAIKKGRSHRLLNALALVALVQCERTLTKNPNNLGSSAISTRFYSLYCVYYLTRYLSRVFMLVRFCSQRIGFYTGMFNDKLRGICCSFDEKWIQEILSEMVKLCKFRGICCSFDEKFIQEILSEMVKVCKFRGICCSFDEKCIREILSEMVKLCMLLVLLKFFSYSLWKRMRNFTEFRNYLRSTWQTWNDLIA